MHSSVEKVLIIAYYFPPMGLSGVQRITKFVKYLPQFGWQPIIITPGAASYYAYDPSLLEEVEQLEIRTIRTDHPLVTKSPQPARYYPARPLQRLYHFLTSFYAIPDTKRRWKRRALQAARNLLRNTPVDVIFATAPPFTNFLIGAHLAEEFELPLVLDYRDPWIDNPFHFYPTPYHRFRNRQLEEHVLRRASAVIVLTRSMKEQLLQHYRFLQHNDIFIIPHGYDPEDFILHGTSQNAEKFVLTYSGLFQDNRTPRYFLAAVSELCQQMPELRQQIELRFIGLLRKRDERLIAKYSLEDVSTITGYLPHGQLIHHLTESTVLWLMLQDQARTPEKLFEYFGARKPILAMLTHPALTDLLQQYGAAVITDPTDVASIRDALYTLIQQWQTHTLPKPDETFVKQFDRRLQTETLAKILRTVIPIEK